MREYYSVPAERLGQAEAIVKRNGYPINVIGVGFPLGGGPRTAEFDAAGFNLSDLDQRVLQEWQLLGVRPIKKISVDIYYIKDTSVYKRTMMVPQDMDIKDLCRILEVDYFGEYMEANTPSAHVVGDFANKGRLKNGVSYIILNFTHGFNSGIRKFREAVAINPVS